MEKSLCLVFVWLFMSVSVKFADYFARAADDDPDRSERQIEILGNILILPSVAVAEVEDAPVAFRQPAVDQRCYLGVGFG